MKIDCNHSCPTVTQHIWYPITLSRLHSNTLTTLVVSIPFQSSCQTLSLASEVVLMTHFPMKNMAQLLYKTYMNCAGVLEEQYSQAFLTSFRKVSSQCVSNADHPDHVDLKLLPFLLRFEIWTRVYWTTHSGQTFRNRATSWASHCDPYYLVHIQHPHHLILPAMFTKKSV